MDEPTPDIASPEEVLAAFTAALRGERGEKPAEQLKAAEHLARHYGILSQREEPTGAKPEIAADIEAAMRQLETAAPLEDVSDGQDGP